MFGLSTRSQKHVRAYHSQGWSSSPEGCWLSSFGNNRLHFSLSFSVSQISRPISVSPSVSPDLSLSLSISHSLRFRSLSLALSLSNSLSLYHSLRAYHCHASHYWRTLRIHRWRFNLPTAPRQIRSYNFHQHTRVWWKAVLACVSHTRRVQQGFVR